MMEKPISQLDEKEIHLKNLIFNPINISVVDILGPKRDNLNIVIPITIVYAVIFLTGLTGNISTCFVIWRNKSMHTATNYYLFSLAISDLLLLISGLPQEMYSIWSRYPYIFGKAFCILRGLFSETSANATVLTITAFTFERYLAICHPFLSYTMSKLSRVIKVILIIWIVAILFAVPQALQFDISILIQGNPESEICLMARIIVPHSFEFSTFVFFLTPLLLIIVLYILIGIRLKSSDRMKKVTAQNTNSTKTSGRNNGNFKHRSVQSTRRVLKMLVAVVVAFFLCWAPFHVQRLVAIYGVIPPDRKKFLKIYEIVTYISGILFYVSTTINPLLYNIMSNKFREAFKVLFFTKRSPCSAVIQMSNVSNRSDNILHTRSSQERSGEDLITVSSRQEETVLVTTPTSRCASQNFPGYFEMPLIYCQQIQLLEQSHRFYELNENS